MTEIELETLSTFFLILSILDPEVRECLNQLQTPVSTQRVYEGIALHLSGINFRKSTFEPPETMPIGPYESYKDMKKHHTESPAVTKYLLQVGDIRISDELKDSKARNILYVPRSTRSLRNGRFIEALRFNVLIWPAARNIDFEAELKASVQPLNIVLDQVTLNTLRVYQECLNKLSDTSFQQSEHFMSILPILQEDSSGFDAESDTEGEERPLFIRKFSFSPSLTIHFDYHGHRLDMSQVSSDHTQVVLLK